MNLLRKPLLAASLVLIAPVFLAPVMAGAQQPVTTSPATNSGRSTVYAPNAVMATSQPLATSAGLDVMRRGGNAIDAAIAAAAVLNLVEPHMTGLGGDAFALLWSAREERLVGMAAVGPAGSLMTRDELIRRGHDDVPGSGAEAITVPGALAGWSALIERYGTMELAEVLEPAIRLAEEGFPVSPIIASDWSRQVDKLRRDEGAAATYLVDRGAEGGAGDEASGEAATAGRAPRAGEWFRNPSYARTLRLIAEEGASAMYGGELGRRIADRVRELGGFLTPEDMTRVEVEWVEPVGMRFGDYKLYELPPPGQGVAALEMLGILKGFDLAAMGHNSPEYLHHLIEAKKLAYADLAGHVGDPAHMRISPADLLTNDYLARRRALLDPETAAERVAPGQPVTDGETIYLAAADADGNMVSFINSVYGYFGSGVVVPGTGFVLQNRGAGFTLEEGHPNMVAPGKRPFHTLIPGFATRITDRGEEPWMAFGVMGGAMQPQGHVQVLLNMILFDMDPQEANDAGRFYHRGSRVGFEAPFSDSVLDELRRRGHRAWGAGDVSYSPAFGGCQMVVRLPRGWAASSDVRKDGHAAGF